MKVKSLLKKPIEADIGGIPLPVILLMACTSIIIWQSGALGKTGLIGSYSFMMFMGMILFVIGDKLPIWNKYIGGGYVMAFLGGAVLVKFELISAFDAKIMTFDAIGNRFMYLCLIMLIGGNILAVHRKTLIKSLIGYVPIIIFGIIGASALGILGGFIFGIAPARIMIMYVLPVMGGGNGAGAIPMAEIYEAVTGKPGGNYYSFAISILTLANIIAIISGAILNSIGEKYPSLTGNGKLMKVEVQTDVDQKLADVEVTNRDHFAAIYLSFGVAGLSFILYAVFDPIHVFAYAVLIFLAMNMLNVISDPLKVALFQVMNFGLKLFIPMVLFAIGVGTDLQELIDAITFTNLILATLIVFGAILGTALSARFFGFYAIEASITAGLCMANRGGSGDLEVLGASKRMELYPYAQISSRIGGAIVLVLAGYLFGALI